MAYAYLYVFSARLYVILGYRRCEILNHGNIEVVRYFAGWLIGGIGWEGRERLWAGLRVLVVGARLWIVRIWQGEDGDGDVGMGWGGENGREVGGGYGWVG